MPQQQFGTGGLTPEGQLNTFHGKPLRRPRAMPKHGPPSKPHGNLPPPKPPARGGKKGK